MVDEDQRCRGHRRRVHSQLVVSRHETGDESTSFRRRSPGPKTSVMSAPFSSIVTSSSSTV
jgi:hypothetical protein